MVSQIYPLIYDANKCIPYGNQRPTPFITMKYAPLSHLISRELSLLDLDDLVPIVVDSLDSTPKSPNGSGTDDDVLDAEDVAAMSDPVEGGVSENVGEADEGHDVGDTGSCAVCDSSLDRREHGSP